MASKLDITLPEASVSTVKRNAAALSDILETKFGCVATIEGVDLENKGISYHRQPPIIAPEKRSEFMTRSGVKVSVWKADLTNFPVDAVVNAANEQLNHCGGLALALSNAGGPQIQLESNEFVRRKGDLKTGDAVVFDAGLLKCKKIIHAVGPYLPTSPSKYDVHVAKPLLQNVIWSILNRVAEHQLATVAIPAISSGLFHYPVQDCADTIVSTIKQYYDNLPPRNHRPKEIFLANHDDPTVQEMERACYQIFSPHMQQSSTQITKNTGVPANTHQLSVQMGNVLLTLMEGKIEEQRTDVIVNTISEERDLNQGLISKAIYKKAGSNIQIEIKSAAKRGNIICTRAHNLNCKEVYHTICTGRSRSHSEWATLEQILRTLESSVFECLAEATAKQHNSISFPAIGTGNLGIPKKKAASVMSKAVAEFAERCQRKLRVYFVIFPTDRETYQAFEAEIKVLQEKVSNFILATAASGHTDDSHTSRTPIPKINLHSPCDESKREAKKWLIDHLFACPSTVEICNNFISHFSEADHLKLARLAEEGLNVEEFFSQGHACLKVKGKPDAVVGTLQVEAMLCKVQKDFIADEEHELRMLADRDVSWVKNETVNQTSHKFLEQIRRFKPLGLWVVKVEEVENVALKVMFDMKKKHLQKASSQTMFQRIPAQFCKMISRIGFQAECAPPEDPVYGEGMYFARTIKKALEIWRGKNEEYLYFVEADVLTGKSAPGKRGMILPPPVGNDPNIFHDSLEGPDVSVIFSGYQALPKYIIVCTKESVV